MVLAAIGWLSVFLVVVLMLVPRMLLVDEPFSRGSVAAELWGEVCEPRAGSDWIAVGVSAFPSDIALDGHAPPVAVRGSMHYELLGPEDGELVILAHGITSSSLVMRQLAADLAEGGFRALLFDFFGRGHSEGMEDLAHSHVFMAEQIHALLDALHVDGRISAAQRDRHHFASLSMGGAVSVVYAATHPERVQSLFLLAPAGLPFQAAAIGNMVTLPLIPELLRHTYWSQVLLDGRVAKAFQGYPAGSFARQELLLRLGNAFHIRKQGFFHALASTLLHFPLNNATSYYAEVGKRGIPLKALWGTADATVPASCATHAKELVPHAEIQLDEGTGHMLIWERPEVAAKSALDFLRAHPIDTQRQ